MSENQATAHPADILNNAFRYAFKHYEENTPEVNSEEERYLMEIISLHYHRSEHCPSLVKKERDFDEECASVGEALRVIVEELKDEGIADSKSLSKYFEPGKPGEGRDLIYKMRSDIRKGRL